MNRRRFVIQSSLAAAGVFLSSRGLAGGSTSAFPVVRVPLAKRKFRSEAVEQVIKEVTGNIGNKEIAWLFGNCFPNTLDTTVNFEVVNGRPDTFVITGDIDAMWLRDSSAQIWPYLPLCKEDNKLKELVKGVINRQVKCIQRDPYANAFYKSAGKISEWHTDNTDMKPGVHERKWEIDSLCYPIRLAHGYWKETGDTSPFDAHWVEAMKLVLRTFKEQQRLDGDGPYSFMRKTEAATDTVPLLGYGYPAKPNGMICSMFRPSDDATVYPYLIPSNIFAIHSLLQLTELVEATHAPIPVQEIDTLRTAVTKAVEKYGKIKTDDHGEIFAFEVNGFGSFNLMDDANVPSLLALSYLTPSSEWKELYANTRRFALSEDNPFFFKGKAAEGIGGPHVAMDYIWPISIIMRGLTSTDDAEIKLCIDMLQKTHAGKGFMHESFHKDDPKKFTRSWFAWANTLFGEFIWKVYRERPQLLS